MQIGFLGTGAANGVPAFYCGCVACKEAEAAAAARRTRCALVVRGSETTLIDAGPDLRQQLLREGIDRVDNLLLTHTHFDHAGGLPELEFYVRLRRKAPIPAIMSRESAEWVTSTLGYMADCLELRVVEAGETVVLDGVRYSALAVTHSPGAFGFLIENEAGCRVAYLPDTGPLPGETALRVAAVDVLIVGATFFGANWMPEDHLSVDEAVALGGQVGARETYVTHVSMHYDTPVGVADLERHIAGLGGPNVHLAYDGLWLEPSASSSGSRA